MLPGRILFIDCVYNLSKNTLVIYRDQARIRQQKINGARDKVQVNESAARISITITVTRERNIPQRLGDEISV